MNHQESFGELIKLSTQAFISIDAAKQVISQYYKTLNYDLLIGLDILLNDLQNLHCDIEINLIKLQKQINA